MQTRISRIVSEDNASKLMITITHTQKEGYTSNYAKEATKRQRNIEDDVVTHILMPRYHVRYIKIK